MADRKRPPTVIWSALFFCVFFGLIGFYNVTHSPTYEAYRTIDVIQLLASGGGLWRGGSADRHSGARGATLTRSLIAR
jgi:hypothetical protein